MEGFFGAVIMSVIVLPATYFIPHKSGNSSLDLLVNSFHDDSIDAFVQMGNNHLLLGFCLLYVIRYGSSDLTFSTSHLLVLHFSTFLASAFRRSCLQYIAR